VNSRNPTSVYFDFLRLGYLVEVFDSSASRALKLILSGQIRVVSQ
jgi:hypothetical protein